MKKIAYYLLGVSGSGKSTFVKHTKKNLQGNPVIATFSHDNNFIAFKIQKAGEWSNDSDAEVYKQAREFSHNHPDFIAFEKQVWEECLKADVLFIDTMHVTKKSRGRYLADAKAKKFEIWGIQFMTSLKTLLDRQNTRTDKCVPESIVRDAYMHQQELLPPSEVDFMFLVDGTEKEPNLYSMNTASLFRKILPIDKEDDSWFDHL